MDVVPGRYTYTWFEATKPGRYELFCAEYCGTNHSGMVGYVVVMEPTEYQAWLSGGATDSPAAQGQKIFQDIGCATCHREDSQGRGPMLQGLFGKPVLLQSGQTVTADEAYIRESIVNPRAQVVQGFQPIMPTYQGQVSEEQILQLISYIRSLGTQPAAGATGSTRREGADTTTGVAPDSQRMNPIAPTGPTRTAPTSTSTGGTGGTRSEPEGLGQPQVQRTPARQRP